MKDRIKVALILAVAIVLGALLHGGIYEIEGAAPLAYKINKFTGTTLAYGGETEFHPKPKERTPLLQEVLFPLQAISGTTLKGLLRKILKNPDYDMVRRSLKNWNLRY